MPRASTSISAARSSCIPGRRAYAAIRGLAPNETTGSGRRRALLWRETNCPTATPPTPRESPASMTVQPLSGIRVVDLTRVLSGPFATMLLADMGADVVKIETPQGDTVRGQGEVVAGLSWYFASFNRNKRSVVLDLRQDEGKAVLARLIERADVLVENFRPGVLAEMGFSESRLEAINPRLIVASINGYGSTGPYVDRPSFDSSPRPCRASWRRRGRKTARQCGPARRSPISSPGSTARSASSTPSARAS
jgi:hypothetical protein